MEAAVLAQCPPLTSESRPGPKAGADQGIQPGLYSQLCSFLCGIPCAWAILQNKSWCQVCLPLPWASCSSHCSLSLHPHPSPVDVSTPVAAPHGPAHGHSLPP